MKKNAIPKYFTANADVSNVSNVSANITVDPVDPVDSSEIASFVSSNSNENTLEKEKQKLITNYTTDEISEPIQVKSAQGANKHYKSNVVAPTDCCNSAKLYQIAKAEYANLQQEYIEFESKRCIEVEKLENELKMYKHKAAIQKQEIKYLSNKVSKLEKTEKSLKTLLKTLKDLQEQNILSAEAYEALEVNCLVF